MTDFLDSTEVPSMSYIEYRMFLQEGRPKLTNGHSKTNFNINIIFLFAKNMENYSDLQKINELF